MTEAEARDLLRSSTPSERIRAIRNFYLSDAATDTPAVIDALEWAAKAAEPDGWQHIAPAWLIAGRERMRVARTEAIP